MPTLKQRVETLEAEAELRRDPIAHAASKGDHTLEARLLSLESQYAELKKEIAVTREEHAATQKLIIQHDASIETLDAKLKATNERVDNWVTTPTPEAPHA